MRKHFFTVITLMVMAANSASAQTVWGVRAGASKPTITVSGDDAEWLGDKIKGKFGIEVGPTLYCNLKNNWYINSGAMLSMKTATCEWSESDYDGNYKEEDNFNFMYFEIPLNIGYAFKIGTASLYTQAGPYIGVKLFEKISCKYVYESSKYGIDRGSEALAIPVFSKINAGVGAMVGINVNKFKIEAGYQAGLANIVDKKAKIDDGEESYNAWESNSNVKINSLFLGVSYVF